MFQVRYVRAILFYRCTRGRRQIIKFRNFVIYYDTRLLQKNGVLCRPSRFTIKHGEISKRLYLKKCKNSPTSSLVFLFHAQTRCGGVHAAVRRKIIIVIHKNIFQVFLKFSLGFRMIIFPKSRDYKTTALQNILGVPF